MRYHSIFFFALMKKRILDNKISFCIFFPLEGEWVDGVKHGRGRFTFGDGGFYEGEFRNGEITGFGCRCWIATGNSYQGDFLDGEVVSRELFIGSGVEESLAKHHLEEPTSCFHPLFLFPT